MFKLQRKSLDSILSGFTRTINELEDFITTKREENAVLNQEIVSMTMSVENNNAEINKAIGAVTNIKNIIN